MAGTVMVKDLNLQPGPTSIIDLTNVNGTVFFAVVGAGRDPISLWKSDGTSAGTVPVRPDIVGVDGLTNINGRLAFTSQDVVPAIDMYGNSYMRAVGQDLWITDGTDNGTVLLKHFDYLSLGQPVNVNGTIYITYGTKLWKSDGTAAGTSLVKDFGTELFIDHLTFFNGTLYFVGRAIGTTSLWKSDGTEAGTVPIKDFGTEASFYLTQLTNVNGKLYFPLIEQVTPYEPATISVLWESDGTEAGTMVVPETSTNPNFSYLFQLTSVNGKLFFVDLVNTGPTNIQGLIVGKVDDGNGPPFDPVDLSTLDVKTVTWPPERGVDYAFYILPGAPVPDSFSALLMPRGQSPQTPSTINAGVPSDLSNIQISLAMANSTGPVAYQSNGSSQSSESLQSRAQTSNPLSTGLDQSNTPTTRSNQVLISPPRGGFSVAEEELTFADLDRFFALEAKDPETMVVLGD